MTRLLVSVRNAEEARIAVAAGVHLVDVKEPLRGPLGAAEDHVIREVAAVLHGQVPMSVALGELMGRDGQRSADLSELSVSFAKWGLAHAAGPGWMDIWSKAISGFPPQTQAVAVQYADWQRAHAPAPAELLTACRRFDVRTLLVDTYEKQGQTLLDVWPSEDLRAFLDAARDGGMMIVLAGSLTEAMLPRVLRLQPDYVAVRGAACIGGREGRIDASRVRHLLAMLEEQAQKT